MWYTICLLHVQTDSFKMFSRLTARQCLRHPFLRDAEEPPPLIPIMHADTTKSSSTNPEHSRPPLAPSVSKVAVIAAENVTKISSPPHLKQDRAQQPPFIKKQKSKTDTGVNPPPLPSHAVNQDQNEEVIDMTVHRALTKQPSAHSKASDKKMPINITKGSSQNLDVKKNGSVSQSSVDNTSNPAQNTGTSTQTSSMPQQTLIQQQQPAKFTKHLQGQIQGGLTKLMPESQISLTLRHSHRQQLPASNTKYQTYDNTDAFNSPPTNHPRQQSNAYTSNTFKWSYRTKEELLMRTNPQKRMDNGIMRHVGGSTNSRHHVGNEHNGNQESDKQTGRISQTSSLSSASTDYSPLRVQNMGNSHNNQQSQYQPNHGSTYVTSSTERGLRNEEMIRRARRRRRRREAAAAADALSSHNQAPTSISSKPNNPSWTQTSFARRSNPNTNTSSLKEEDTKMKLPNIQATHFHHQVTNAHHHEPSLLISSANQQHHQSTASHQHQHEQAQLQKEPREKRLNGLVAKQTSSVLPALPHRTSYHAAAQQ